MTLRPLVLMFALAGCSWVRNHPAVTAATITGAAIGLGTCELGDDQDRTKICLISGGVVAAVFGGLTLLATTFLNTNEPAAAPPATTLTGGGAIRVHTQTLPPPVPVDAGAAAADAAPSPIAAPADAAVIIDAAS